MSAFVVDKAHINAIINAGLSGHDPLTWYHDNEHHQLNYDNANEVGQMLLDECMKSVMYRYEDSFITDLPGRVDAEYLIPFKFKPSYDHMPAVQVFKLIHCYEYQSCEHPEWEDSEAHTFCQALERRLIYRLPGYEEAEWEWTEWPEEKPLRIL